MAILQINHSSVLTKLRRRWLTVALSYGAAILLGYGILHAWWQPTYATRWVVMSTPVLIYELWFLWRILDRNRRHGEQELLPTFGVGSALTLLRGLLIGLIAGFLFSPWPPTWLAWIPGLLYLLAGVADYLDGYLARVTRHSTILGEALDMELDALGILVVPLLAMQYGQLPVWYLLVSAARYLFLFGIWLLRRRGKPVYDLTPSPLRRALAGFQMGFIGVVLLPVFTAPGTHIAATAFMIPFLVNFAHDWLLVSGGLNPTSPYYRQVMHVAHTIAFDWLPVVLRTTVAFSVILRSLPLGILQIVALVLVGFLALGVAGRLSSVALLLLTGFVIKFDGLDLPASLIVVGTTGLLLLGSGMLSLWRPEDRFLQHRAGER